MGNARRLAGLLDVVTARMASFRSADLGGPEGSAMLEAAEMGWPVLLRSPGYQTGEHFVQVVRPADLPDAIADLPGAELLAIEYVDSRSGDGAFRKYRVMTIGGRLYPIHLAIAPEWKVHYFRSAMAERLDHREEEAAFLTGMRAVCSARARSPRSNASRSCSDLTTAGSTSRSSRTDAFWFSRRTRRWCSFRPMPTHVGTTGATRSARHSRPRGQCSLPALGNGMSGRKARQTGQVAASANPASMPTIASGRELGVTRALAVHALRSAAASRRRRPSTPSRPYSTWPAALCARGSRARPARRFTARSRLWAPKERRPRSDTVRLFAPQYAALLNACNFHALDFDDTHERSSLHPGAPVVGAALVEAERLGASGARLLSAIVAGYDVAVRLGIALNPPAHYARGFHPSATAGVFGATAAVARLHGDDAELLESAFGINLSQAAGSLQFSVDGAQTKPLQVGFAAHNAILARELAAAGVRGPAAAIEGRSGLLHAYSDGADAADVLDLWDGVREIDRTAFKPYPCCRYMHAAIELLAAIVREHGLTPAQIDRVRVSLPAAGMRLCAYPEARKRRPQTIVDAQFSMYYTAAATVGLGQRSLGRFRAPRRAGDRRADRAHQGGGRSRDRSARTGDGGAGRGRRGRRARAANRARLAR